MQINNIVIRHLQDLFLLHQALSPESLSSQNLLRNGVCCIQLVILFINYTQIPVQPVTILLCCFLFLHFSYFLVQTFAHQLHRSLIKGRTTGRWLKDQKERKKQEIRTHNAQLHAAVSVVGVASAVVAIAASIASSEKPNDNQKNLTMASAAISSAAALVASHCIEIAENMGAEQDQIITAVNSAINAKTNGDIMTLTAGAATGIRNLNSICSSDKNWTLFIKNFTY